MMSNSFSRRAFPTKKGATRIFVTRVRRNGTVIVPLLPMVSDNISTA